MTIQMRENSRTTAIRNTDSASSIVDPVIRDSTEIICLNFGKITSPPTTPPAPKAPNNNPKPVEFNPSTCLAKTGKRDRIALPHITNKPARTIST